MKTSKYYLVGLTAIVVGLMCCGPVSAEYVSVYDFDGLTKDVKLSGQDNWLYVGSNNYVTVRDEGDANKYGVPGNWTGFSGKVAEGGSPDTTIGRLNDTNWSFSIPSSAPEAQFSYTIFTRGARSNLAGLYMGDQQMFVFGVNYNSNVWRFRDRNNGTTTAAGTGNATLSSTYKSYILTVDLDFTNPDGKVYADMWVENLTDGGGAVEVMSDINLNLVGAELNPSNWDTLLIRPYVSAMDDVTVTAIPEPSTLVGLLGLGLLGLVAWRRR